MLIEMARNYLDPTSLFQVEVRSSLTPNIKIDEAI